MKRSIILIITLCICFYTICGNAQNGRDTILTEISSILYLTTGDVGEGTPSHLDNSIRLVQLLSQSYSNTELRELTTHQNSKVKCFSFWALARAGEEKLYKIILENIQDSSLNIEISHGCFAVKSSSFEYMLRVVSKCCKPLFRDCTKLSESEITELLNKRIELVPNYILLNNWYTNWQDYFDDYVYCYK